MTYENKTVSSKSRLINLSIVNSNNFQVKQIFVTTFTKEKRLIRPS